jgi:hypothetical protein
MTKALSMLKFPLPSATKRRPQRENNYVLRMRKNGGVPRLTTKKVA